MADRRHDKKGKYQTGDLVYLMRRKNGDYKIGKTNNLPERYYRICSECKERLEVIAYLDGYTALEDAIQGMFEEYRIYNVKRYKTDWFRPAPEILKWFKEYATMWEDAPLFTPLEKPVKPVGRNWLAHNYKPPQWLVDEYEEKLRAWEAKQHSESK